MNYTTSPEQMFRTTDFDSFKRVLGNRKVLEERVSKILASYDKIGYIPVPIIVNEKFEVIDGQGRLEACKRRSLPVNFIIRPGLKIEDCIVMNINVSPWTLMDYIECYAETGNENYQWMVKLFEEMFEKHGKKCVTVNNVCTTLFNTKKAPGTAIKNGRLRVTEEMYLQAKDCLDFVFSILDYYKENNVRLKSNDISDLMTSIIFCYKFEDVNNDKLYKVLTEEGHLMQKWTNVETCISEIDFRYNYNAKANRCNIVRLYEDLSNRDQNLAPNFVSYAPSFLEEGYDYTTPEENEEGEE